MSFLNIDALNKAAPSAKVATPATPALLGDSPSIKPDEVAGPVEHLLPQDNVDEAQDLEEPDPIPDDYDPRGVPTFDTVAPALRARGFIVIPITPGTKAPTHLKEWSDPAAANECNAAEFEDYGVGFLTGHGHVALDLDVTESKIAMELDALAVKILGNGPLRIGKAPKRLRVYRCATQFQKMKFTFTLNWAPGKNHAVEILATGQQFVGFGIHPDTNQPYTWPDGNDLLTVALDDVPMTTEEQWRKFMNAATALVKKCGKIVESEGKKNRGRPKLDETILSDGNRNAGMFKWAMRQRSKGVNGENLWNRALEHNAQFCRPPLDEGELQTIIKSAEKYEVEVSIDNENDARPRIAHVAGMQPEIIEQVLAILAARAVEQNLMIYTERMVHAHVVQLKAAGFKKSDVECLQFSSHTSQTLALIMNRVSLSYRLDDKGDPYVVDFPTSLARLILDSPPLWGGLPTISRLSETPVLAGERLICTPGYDRETGVWINAPLVEVPERPTKEDARAAFARLLTYIEEFPFESELDKAAAMAAMFTAALRSSLPTAPGFLFTKPDFGVGASTLAKLVHLILTGRMPAVVTSEKGDEEELRKHIDGIMLSGRPAVILDNLKAGSEIVSQTINQLLTEPMRSVRVLGKNEKEYTAVCSQLVILNGVNISVPADLVRRCLRVSMDRKMERAQDYQFKRPQLLDDVARDRVAILRDIHTVIRAFELSGESVPVTTYNGYDEWNRRVAQPLVWMGMVNPIESGRALEAYDAGRDALGQMLKAWHDAYANNVLTARELLDEKLDPTMPAGRLRDTLLMLANPRKGQERAAVGLYLSRNRSKIVDGRRLQNQPKGGRYWVEQLYEVEGEAAQAEADRAREKAVAEVQEQQKMKVTTSGEGDVPF